MITVGNPHGPISAASEPGEQPAEFECSNRPVSCRRMRPGSTAASTAMLRSHWREEAAGDVAAGLGAAKLKVEFGIADDAAAARAVRAAIGPGTGLMVGANPAYDALAAIRLGRKKIADMAAPFGMRYNPHVWSTGIGIAARCSSRQRCQAIRRTRCRQPNRCSSSTRPSIQSARPSSPRRSYMGPGSSKSRKARGSVLKLIVPH